MQSLRRLDDRVIGSSRRSQREQARQCFLIGLGGCIAILALALGFRRPWLVSSVGGFVGLTFGGAVRWWNAPSGGERDRSMPPLMALAVVVLGGVVAVFVTIDRGDVGSGYPTQPTLDPYRNIRTMVVLCERTPRGDAYTYQAAATDVPKCTNGAVPNVVVRG